MVPSRSAISIRPSGVNRRAVGSSSPRISLSLTSLGAVLATVTDTAALVVRLPAASRAIAVTACVPAAAVALSQLTEYGAVVSSPPRLTPSSWNWTPATPRSSLAVAATVTTPDTAPADGVVSVTAGAVVSGGPGVSPTGVAM